MTMKYQPLLIFFLLLWNSALFAGEADVLGVKVNQDSEGSYRFTITVSHQDAGWKHYSNKWDIVDEKGTVLATRVLHHPHVEEQPFSRSLSGVEIPDHIKTVTVRAHDSVHEYGGEVMQVDLP